MTDECLAMPSSDTYVLLFTAWICHVCSMLLRIRISTFIVWPLWPCQGQKERITDIIVHNVSLVLDIGWKIQRTCNCRIIWLLSRRILLPYDGSITSSVTIKNRTYVYMYITLCDDVILIACVCANCSRLISSTLYAYDWCLYNPHL